MHIVCHLHKELSQQIAIHNLTVNCEREEKIVQYFILEVVQPQKMRKSGSFGHISPEKSSAGEVRIS